MILNNERCCHCLLDEINLSTSLGAGVANKLHGINQIKRNSSITYIGLCYSNIVLEIITQSDLGLISVGGGAGSHQNCNFLRFMRQSEKKPQCKRRLCDAHEHFCLYCRLRINMDLSFFLDVFALINAISPLSTD